MSFDSSSPSNNPSTANGSTISPPTGQVGKYKQRSRRNNRYSPYPNPQRSVHQLHVSYLDPAYIEDLVDISMPRVRLFPDAMPLLLNHIPQPPRQVLEAALELPPRNWWNDQREENAVVEQGPVRRVFAWIVEILGSIKQAVLPAV
ncbi:hypothetical protein Hypma_015042 [Hypsizygus marmoreus]|uniref:Uncharacterized protein n=1 Tax=Hypsizygus marmoreus TaxID=39966 RepID=A0A369K6X2_HYPMA|nr:hypothetical protein Hypma_015042 [Hypsizygus marmoreus]